MVVLGGMICRMPVSFPVRQELYSCKLWPAWTGIKAAVTLPLFRQKDIFCDNGVFVYQNNRQKSVTDCE